MVDQRVVSGVVLDEAVSLTLTELCRCCDVSAEYIVEMIDEGVLAPEGDRPDQWRFRGVQVKRVQTALRLAEDLEINMPGIALALELLDELDRLRVLRQRPMPGRGRPPL